MNLQPIQVISNIPQPINSVLNPVKLTSVIQANVDSSLLLEPFDFLVIKYKWPQTGGKDLDTRTAIVGSSDGAINGQDVGWNRGLIYDATKRYIGDKNDPYLLWGGDNTGSGGESVLINFKKLSEDLPDPTFEIRLRAFFYEKLRSGDIT